MLQIPSLSERDTLFQFMDELKQWAKHELQRHGVQDLIRAISAAEFLIEFWSSRKVDSKDKGRQEVRKTMRSPTNQMTIGHPSRFP